MKQLIDVRQNHYFNDAAMTRWTEFNTSALLEQSPLFVNQTVPNSLFKSIDIKVVAPRVLFFFNSTRLKQRNAEIKLIKQKMSKRVRSIIYRF